MTNIELIREVKRNATNHWDSLLPLCGVNVPERGKHGACPVCGGTDRFHFIDDHHNGNWFCRQCDEPNHGDGLDLIAKVKGISIYEAAKEVSQALSLPLPEPARKEAPKSESQPITEKVQKLVAQTTVGKSAYLTQKGHECPVKLLADGSMLLIIQRGSEVTGAQIIKPNGEKRLISGTKKKGSFILLSELPETTETVLIAEGYATALTVSQLHSGLVLAAIDEGNLLSVTEWARKHYPKAKIIIAADNDIKIGQPNVGKISAEKAAKMVNGWVTLPPTEDKADWDDYRQQFGIEKAKQAFNEGMYQMDNLATVTVIHVDKKGANTNLSQMAASQRGALLAELFGKLAIIPDSEMVYHYVDGVWNKVSDSDLQRAMVAIFDEYETPYSPTGVKNAIGALKLQIPVLGEQKRELIGFSNGVYDLSTQQFKPHAPENWLLNHNGIVFTEPEPNENLKQHAPSFYKWLSHSAGNDEEKMNRINAGLFMILANRYDWQLFIEVTGEGGSGKSVFTSIATLLAGAHNTASGNMKALDEARGRYQFVGKSLITLPDQVKYVGEGAGIKAITGGDLIEVDGKYEKQFSTIIKAVVLATNNEPMSFTERNGGIARRRVIFSFNTPVKENDKDPLLPEKISKELPVIIRYLLKLFTSQDKAKLLLQEQRDSGEALAVKSNSDPLYSFCAYLVSLGEELGMKMGNKNIYPRAPRIYLYHAYLSFMEAYGFDRPLTLTKFGDSLPKVMQEYKKDYRKFKTKRGYYYNVDLTDDANEWLPAVPELRQS
ncbi:primase-like DNA-binding domain-containing protein [Proteus terrae]|uniref:primase-like DNA-binding domain-containing protein n=1 Tax=Proteus terrae TaxID=1574161 RepID=UPI000D69F460|nr:primase-like DNA-binding domain-containing protein [Proteus terrae]